MSHRIERDSLGEKQVPEYAAIETPVRRPRVKMDLV